MLVKLPNKDAGHVTQILDYVTLFTFIENASSSSIFNLSLEG